MKKIIVALFLTAILFTGVARAQTTDANVLYVNLLKQVLQLLMQELAMLEQQLAALQASQSTTTSVYVPSQTLLQIQQITPDVFQSPQQSAPQVANILAPQIPTLPGICEGLDKQIFHPSIRIFYPSSGPTGTVATVEGVFGYRGNVVFVKNTQYVNKRFMWFSMPYTTNDCQTLTYTVNVDSSQFTPGDYWIFLETQNSRGDFVGDVRNKFTVIAQ